MVVQQVDCLSINKSRTDLKSTSSEKMAAPALDAKTKGNSEKLIFTITYRREKKTWLGYGFFWATAKFFLKNKCT